jgi:hypothetical protein
VFFKKYIFYFLKINNFLMFSNYFIVLILKIIKKYKKFILMNENIKSFGKTISFWNKNKKYIYF